MKWILIIMITGYKSSALAPVEFDSLAACDFAAKMVKAEFNSQRTISTVCVPKNKD